MSNDALNSLRKQLTFDFMLDFTVELTSEEVALLTLFENLDYSAFGTRLGRKDLFARDGPKKLLFLRYSKLSQPVSPDPAQTHPARRSF